MFYLEKDDGTQEKRRLKQAVFIPFLLVVCMFLSFILEKGMGWDFHKAGIYPRHLEGAWGVLTCAFVHADWEHLFNNLLSFFILASVLFYFYSPLAGRILLLSYLFSGIVLWCIGRDNWHIGASGMIYALAFFLFTSGVLRKYAPLAAISLFVVFLYGNMVWHVFPWQEHDPTSWEGHLGGLLTGVVLAIIYRHQGPQKPVKVWEEEEEEETGNCGSEEAGNRGND